MQLLTVPALFIALQMQQLARGAARTAFQQLKIMAAARAPSCRASTVAVAAPRLTAARAAAPALPLLRAPVAPRSAGLLASVRLQRAICVAARAQAAEAAAAAAEQQQEATPAAAAAQEQQQEDGPKKEYVVVNFFHLVDLERPWEVCCQPGWACDLQRLLPALTGRSGQRMYKFSARIWVLLREESSCLILLLKDFPARAQVLAPMARFHVVFALGSAWQQQPEAFTPCSACPLLQIINASKQWLEGREVRGRIYFSEQARHAALSARLKKELLDVAFSNPSLCPGCFHMTRCTLAVLPACAE